MELIESHINKQIITSSLKGLLMKWIRFMISEKGLAYNTGKSYAFDVVDYINEIKVITKCKSISTEDIFLVDKPTLRRFVSSLRESGSSIPTVNRKISSIKHFYKYMHNNNICSNNEVLGMTQLKAPSVLPRPESFNSVILILEASKESAKSQWENARNYALLSLIYSCGLRVSEAIGITKEHFNLYKGNGYLVIQGKGNKERATPLLKEITVAIEEYLQLMPSTLASHNALFVGKHGDKLSPRYVQHLMQSLRRSLNLPESCTTHALRHSFATHLLESGANLQEIKTLLGHESIQSTQRYIKLEALKLKEAQNIFHPRSGKK